MQIGNYEIVEQLGAGAMGVVYKARHTRVRRNQLFALKLMHSMIADRPDLVTRFHREIEVVGRLEHPNIVNVVDAGEHQGSPYLVMEYLQGEPLEKYVHEKRPVAFNKKLEIMACVCRGLDYAHKQGVVHRDIKPANIILLADLTPKIVDFGVAHIADNTMTKTGLMVGTVSYMSPEQLNGARVDGRSDVFSTTIVLYEFLSNHLPFEGADTAAIMKKILMDAPPPLRQFVEPCPLQAEAILAKGLAKDPAYRFTAFEMATELDRLQVAELAMEAAADAAMQATVIAPSRVQAKPLVAPELQPKTIATPATQPRAAKTVAPPIQVPKQETTKAMEPPVPVSVEKTEVSAPTAEVVPPRKRRGLKWLTGLAIGIAVVLAVIGVLSITGGPANMRRLGNSAVYSVAFSRDGRYVAGTDDYAVIVWNVATGQPAHTLSGHTSYVRSVAFNEDGKYLASAGNDNSVTLWDVASGKELQSWTDHADWVRSVVFSPDGQYLASASDDKTITLRGFAPKLGDDPNSVYNKWNRYLAANPGEEYKEARTLSGHTSSVLSLAFSMDGRYLASGSTDGAIKIWNVATGREVRTLTGHNSAVNSVAFSPDGRSLVSGSSDDTVLFWDVASGHELNTWTGWKFSVLSVAFSPDGRFVAAGGIERRVRLWDVAAGREVRKLDNAGSYLSAIWHDASHAGPSIEAVTFSPDGHTLAVAATNGQGIELWDLTK